MFWRRELRLLLPRRKLQTRETKERFVDLHLLSLDSLMFLLLLLLLLANHFLPFFVSRLQAHRLHSKLNGEAIPSPPSGPVITKRHEH